MDLMESTPRILQSSSNSNRQHWHPQAEDPPSLGGLLYLSLWALHCSKTVPPLVQLLCGCRPYRFLAFLSAAGGSLHCSLRRDTSRRELLPFYCNSGEYHLDSPRHNCCKGWRDCRWLSLYTGGTLRQRGCSWSLRGEAWTRRRQFQQMPSMTRSNLGPLLPRRSPYCKSSGREGAHSP